MKIAENGHKALIKSTLSNWIFFVAIFFDVLLFFPVIMLANTYRGVVVRHSAKAGKVELNIANLLSDRLKEAGIADVQVISKSIDPATAKDKLCILLGKPGNFGEISDYFSKNRIPPLSDLEPGPEGFLLISSADQNLVVAAGIDDRGCLYAVGELLRQIIVNNGVMRLPDKVNIRTAPAFEIRGTQVQQSSVALNLAKVRPWTIKEKQRVYLDYALAGANIFSTGYGSDYDFIKSFGLMTQGDFGANSAGGEIPEEWEAKESIGRTGYVCLSVPAAKQYMIDQCEKYFNTPQSFDLVKFYGGDGGGCECDLCKPYGLTFIRTVEEMAAKIHKYHPETRVYFTNQKFDNNDDLAILAYLQEKPREWLWAWGYGPGSDATSWQPGHRQTHRMDLFRYPGYGPYGLYPKELLHQLPPQQQLLYYNEITHWKYAQHAFIQMYPRPDKDGNQPPHWSHEIYERRPDQFLTMVYNRLSFYACPKNYYRVFNDLMPYGIGDITHSSGHHDHFNQWMWQRLLWSPRTTLDQVVDEYCKSWFGPAAAPLMARALFLLEENIEEQPGTPLPQKQGVKAYYDLVKQAGRLIPKEMLVKDWLWRMYMQKGALDCYTRLSVARQLQLQSRIENHVAAALKVNDTNRMVQEALTWFDLKETDEMKAFRKEAERLGEESNKISGERNDGIFNLKHDFIGLGWLKRQLERSLKADNKSRQELLSMITDYENPGAGGFYDNLGTYNKAPDLVSGYPYDHGQPYVSQMLSEGNRPSQRSMHYTQDEKQGVSFHYSNLDKNGTYKIRFTFVRPWYQERYSSRMNQRGQSVYANDILLVKDVELPLQMSDFFTYDIPAKATAGGELTITLRKSADVANGDRVSVEQWRNSGGWGTIVSEVWLMKKKK
jgi:hypothetical protein